MTTDRKRHLFLTIDVKRQLQQARDEVGEEVSYAEIGRQMGVSQQAIQQAMTGGTTRLMHERISVAIEEILKARAANK